MAASQVVHKRVAAQRPTVQHGESWARKGGKPGDEHDRVDVYSRGD